MKGVKNTTRLRLEERRARSARSLERHPKDQFVVLPEIESTEARSDVLVRPDERAELQDTMYIEWIQHAVDRWFMLYQPTFPLLDDLFYKDQNLVHPILRAALLLALYSIAYRSRTDQKEDARLSSKLLNQYNIYRGLHAKILDRLTCLQITMMLAIEADQRGYDVASSVHTVGFWLSQATAQAYDLRLHDDEAEEMLSTTEELILGRRLYLVLIILDRWHSVSTSSPPFIADHNTRFDIDLQLSGITDHLYRLSIILGHVYAYVLAARSITSGRISDDTMKINFAALMSEIEDWRSRVDVIWGQSNLLHVAYWHVCALSMLSSTTSQPEEVIELRDMAMRLATTLPNSATPYTPLNHHFFTLTTCVLFHLLEFAETREDAHRGLISLAEAVERHRDLVDEDDTSSWDAKLLEVNMHLRNRQAPPDRGSNAKPGELLSSVRRRGYLLSIDQIM